MAFNYEYYIRRQYMPHMWCPGCGLGIVLKAILRAVHALGWEKDDIALVSGIGCTSRMPGYVDFNTLHTTHGRALAFATGIKLVRPDKHVIVVSGDGDAMAIGGNHFIHACRRNIDLNLIIVDNYIYGMTGGQASPTTPVGMLASTSPWGHVEPRFNVAEIAIAAGATYVARATVAQGLILEKYLKNAFAHKGMSVVIVESNCHTQFGRRNRIPDPVELIHWIRDHTIPLRKAETLPPEERREKLVVGELHINTERPEYTEEYRKLIERVMASSNE